MQFQSLNDTTERIRNAIVTLNCSLQQQLLHLEWYWYVLFEKPLQSGRNQVRPVVYSWLKLEEKTMW